MRRFLRLIFFPCVLVSASLAQQGDRQGEVQKPLPEHIQAPSAPVRSPEDQAKTFVLAPGFRAELVAAEPLVIAPVAAQFAPDGRLWIVEMRGFMPNVDGVGEREPVGAVVVLDDTDDDGRYDRRTVFADQLVLPRALSLVADGVLVAEPPHLWFLRDTDGDGKADEKTEIANDYGGTENPEHTANGLLGALDNWIYSANHTVRYRYQGNGKFTSEPTITRGQWGITQDDFGRLYYNNNSEPLRVDAIPAEYLKRNPHLAAGGANVRIVAPKALRLWPARVTPGVNRGYQILDDEGKIREVTAACGPLIYRGALFPPELRGDAFIAEPSGNLVKRIKLTETEAVVSGANAYEGFEFMASTDERFRPVNLLNGPDGALYVVDFYRGILQHRIYMTSFLRKQVLERGLDEGLAHGRIWRIVPEDAPRAKLRRDLGRASVPELVNALRDPNGWVRDTAQRQLVERADRANALEPLLTLALEQGAPSLARVHALWTLDGTGLLDRATVQAALLDTDARVCATAVRLAEKFLGKNATGGDGLAMRVAALSRSEPEVRLQLALTFGELRTAGAEGALVGLVATAGRQRFLADAAVSGLAGREVDFIAALVREQEAETNAGDAVRLAASAVFKSGDAAQIKRALGLLAAEATPGWARGALLAGVRHFLPKSPDGRALVGSLPVEPKALLALAAKPESPHASTAEALLPLLKWPGKAMPDSVAVRPLTAEERARFEKGQGQFAAFCAACHQPNGQGLPGLAPSLVHSKWVLGDPGVLARIVLNGKARENMIMPPWKAAMDDETVAAVLTFLRRSWGHEAEPVAPSAVAEARAATAKREEPFSEAELTALAQTLARPAEK